MNALTKHRFRGLLIAFVCLLAVALLSMSPAQRSRAQGPSYTVTDLGTVGVTSRAWGINNCGSVAGEYANQPAFWKGGVRTDIGTFGGGSGAANAVNASGFVVGSATTSSEEQRAFIWRDNNNNNISDPGELIDIGSLPGGSAAEAYDINDKGEVAGASETNPITLAQSAVIWDQSQGMRALANGPNGFVPTSARGINIDSHMVGVGRTASFQQHAFVFNGTSLTDLGTLGGSSAFALKVQKIGTSDYVVGYSYLSSPNANQPFHAFLWDDANPGQLKDLGTLVGPVSPTTNSVAYDINASSNVVGASDTMVPATMHAFIWHDDNSNGMSDVGEMKDLNTLAADPEWILQDARSINDSGQIVGFGVRSTDPTHVHAFLLTPTGLSPTPCSTAATTVSAVSGSGTYNQPATLTAKLTSHHGPLSGKTIGFSVDSVSVCGGGGGQPACPSTNGSGVATLDVSGINAGAHSIIASFAGDANFAASNGAGTLTVAKASATIALGNLGPHTYDGGAKLATATTNPPGLSGVSINYFQGPTPVVSPTNAGSYDVVASLSNANYQAPNANGTLVISQASSTTTVTVSNATYDGNPHGGTASVTGVGGLNQSLTVTYTGRNATVYGSTTAPTNAGDYTATATFGGDINHTGSSDSEDFQILKAQATITLSNLSQTYDGSAKSATATTSPPGLTGVSITYSQSGTPVAVPINAGSYDVVASLSNANYQATNANGTLVITQASSTTTVTVSNATYDGSPHGGTASVTGVGGLNQSLTVTYTGRNATVYGSTTAPTNAGDYTATATFGGDINHTGSSDSEDFQILKAQATITLSNLSQTYDGSAKSATATTSPPGLTGVSITYSQSGTPVAAPINAGSYDVVASLFNANYQAANASDTLVINKASTGTSVTSSTNPSAEGQTVTFTATVSSPAGTPTGTVQFKAGGANLGSPAPLNAGVATLTTSALAVGTHTITADYSGDSNFGSSSGTLSGGQVVGGVIQFSQPTYIIDESVNFLSINVTRTGNTAGPATVKYATGDATDVNFVCNPNTVGQITGAASRKCDYHIAAGRLRFAAGETSKTIVLSIVNDVYVEGSETLTISLSSPTGGVLGSPNLATVTITDNDTPGQANPIDGTPFYVRMLYVDLLSREPDPAGFAGWVNRIDLCGQPGQAPPPCDRVTVGGDGFLRSAEFFDREFFVIRLYRSGLGRILRYDDVADLAFVSGFLTDADLELNKQEVVNDIMSRTEFVNIYNALPNSQYVDTLISTAAVTLPAGVRDGWVNALNGSTKTRAQVFRELSERSEVSTRYLNEARVVSCYYGFFTRNPDGAYFSFLDRLDRGEINLGDLANAFINAAEYRQRFGP